MARKRRLFVRLWPVEFESVDGSGGGDFVETTSIIPSLQAFLKKPSHETQLNSIWLH